MGDSINGDLNARVVVNTTRMSWAPSPSGTVWRKRLHRVGPAESGQVTSIVRYEPNSSFHGHEHPEGEEILVLEGVFSDEHGDWPAGTYLLNPEGFRHTPFSREGCLLFVKLRQYPGTDRKHVALRTDELPWQPAEPEGRLVRPLYSQPGFSDTVRLEQWPANFDAGRREYPGGVELLILDGELSDEHGAYARGTWMRLPRGASHHPSTRTGCRLYVKEGGLAYLAAGD